MSLFRGLFDAAWSAFRHLFKRRMTLRYPEVKLELQGGYTFDPRKQIGFPGFKGRHILYLDKCTGCQLCAIACQNIADCITMVPLDVPKTWPQNKKGIFPQIDYGYCVFCGFCVLPDTMVFTNPGLKPIRELEVGELVLTHTGEYKPVTRVWDLSYTGPLYRIKAMGKPDPLVCTKDHPILAVRRERSRKSDGRLLRNTKPLEMVLPQDLKLGDYLVTPIPKKTIGVEKYRQLVGLYRGESVKKELVLPAEPDFFRLIGFYLAEGHCSEGRTVTFSFGSSEQDYIHDVSQLLRRYFGRDARIRKNSGKGINVRLNSALAEAFFSNFGNGAQNKRMPDWVLFASVQKQAELIKGLWFGGGSLIRHPRQEFFNFTTTSKTLAMQLQLVLSRLGAVAAVHAQKPKRKKRAYRINVFGKYAKQMAEKCGLPFYYNRSKSTDKFHITEDYVFSPISKIDVYHVENQRVMDVTVDHDHTFVPEGVITSNCVDACPFYALYMTDEYELSATEKRSLIYTPEMLAIPPKPKEERLTKVEIDKRGAYHA